tara:strand:+ start:590 stop:1924 length:1335 start_codon:yes stop_codon:yes gene_type:complete
MKIHILGIGGTFMAGIAILAKQLGHTVTGSDKNLYDPMKSVLIKEKITFTEGYSEKILDNKYDLVIVGNVMSRGMKIIETLLEKNIKFTSGPQWLYDNILSHKKVIAVSGTHGKTTTSSLITWILKYLKFNPSYLIGGLPINLKAPAKLTKSDFFVIEADEYDTAFFDKRSKYMHYHPNIFVINNIEFDHADIFKDIDDIIKNFHHVIRTIPKNGKVIYNIDDKNICKLINEGVWSKTISLSTKKSVKSDWLLTKNKNSFFISQNSRKKIIKSNLIGIHNYKNISLAIIAALQIKIPLDKCLKAISVFSGVKRRMEFTGYLDNIMIFDDFAHHPTEIQSSIQSLRSEYSNKKILSICEIKSNSMISGTHKNELPNALKKSHHSIIVKSNLVKWSLNNKKIKLMSSYTKIKKYIKDHKSDIDIILIMSNKSTKELRKYITNEKNN